MTSFTLSDLPIGNNLINQGFYELLKKWPICAAIRQLPTTLHYRANMTFWNLTLWFSTYFSCVMHTLTCAATVFITKRGRGASQWKPVNNKYRQNNVFNNPFDALLPVNILSAVPGLEYMIFWITLRKRACRKASSAIFSLFVKKSKFRKKNRNSALPVYEF